MIPISRLRKRPTLFLAQTEGKTPTAVAPPPPPIEGYGSGLGAAALH
jgi:hypothetical protein